MPILPEYRQSRCRGYVVLKKLSGFTLVELIVVMAIAALMTRYALSSFSLSTNKYRMQGELNKLVTDIQYARAEAMREGTPASICASTDGATCSPSSTGWQTGWVVFSDPGGNGTVNAGDIILKSQKAFSNGDTFTTASNFTFTFNRLGLLQNGNPGAAATEFTVANSAVSTSLNQCLFVTFLGQVSAKSGASC
jgi:type IV fimbrial biogenesis protein FimT